MISYLAYYSTLKLEPKCSPRSLLTFSGLHSIISENKTLQFVLLIQLCICITVDFVMFQLCTGGSVTDLVQGLKHRNERLTEDQIAYIIRETVEVMYTSTALGN
jgi:hypothetical protein